MTHQRFTVVDAFTDRPFRGNPAAICLLGEAAPEDWMRAVAAEMNLSETAYLVPLGAPDDHRWNLRWFTPTVEIDLCGHATLAAAHVLATDGHLPEGAAAAFDTRSGELRARREEDRTVLDFPAARAERVPVDPALIDALGLAPDDVVAAGRSGPDHLLEVRDPDVVRGLGPDFRALRAVAPHVVTVTAPGDDGPFDCVSRVFGPAVGIDEDPVTGSAHCLLATWWSGQLGRTTLQAHQASARGGELEVRLLDHRVELVGHAVVVSTGDILGPG